MLKLLIGSWVFAALVTPESSVRFENEGLRVGPALVTGAALELKDVGGKAVLASARVIEPLSAELKVELAEGRVLVVEPGVRVTRTKDGFQLTTHAGKALKLVGASFKVESPASFTLTEKGWDFGGGNIVAAAELRTGLQTAPQENPDDSLETMKRAAKRIEKSQTKMSDRATPPGRVPVQRSNPLAGSEAAESQTLRSQTHLSGIGF